MDACIYYNEHRKLIFHSSFTQSEVLFFPPECGGSVCLRGSTDDLGANRGHWGPNPQVWEQAVVQVAPHMPFLLLPHYYTAPGKLKKMKTS